MFCQILLAILAAVAPLIASTSLDHHSLPSAIEAPQDTPWPPVGVYRPGMDVKMPRIVKQQHPRYMVDAIRSKVGRRRFAGDWRPDGRNGRRSPCQSVRLIVNSAWTTKPSRVKKWKFTAGTKDGVAVPVLVEIEMTFSLRK